MAHLLTRTGCHSYSVNHRSFTSKLGHILWKSIAIEAFIGKVEYLPAKRLSKFAEQSFRHVTIPFSLAYVQTLLVKRPAFRHEREVRLLLFRSSSETAGEDVYRYEVDPHMLIDQIMVDPRLSVSTAASTIEEVRSRTGFVGPIKRSLLYAPPPYFQIPI